MTDRSADDVAIEEAGTGVGGAAQDLLAAFQDRDFAVLERVLAKRMRAVPTLEELGRRYGVTRERIRQVEENVASRFAELIEGHRFAELRARAKELPTEVGLACPVAEAPPELQPGAGLTSDLFGHLAGHYTVVDGWVVKREVMTSPSQLALDTFAAVSSAGVAPVEAVFDALTTAGLQQRWQARLMESVDQLRSVDGSYVRWGNHGDRLRSILVLTGRPMTSRELVVRIHEVEPGLASRSMVNALNRQDFVRVGKSLYGLADWGGQAYGGTVAALVELLAAGERSIADVVDELALRYGVSPVSVSMYARMHPRFVARGGVVRLRRDDEPPEIGSSLELSHRCYLIDGEWTWRVPVDADVLRGSGRRVPAAFAAHLGARPLSPSIVLRSGEQSIRVGWSMDSYVGSLRRSAEVLDLQEGDWLFVRRGPGETLQISGLPRSKVAAASIADQVCLLVGAPVGTGQPLVRILGGALGVSDEGWSPSRCIAVLTQRREEDLVALIQADSVLKLRTLTGSAPVEGASERPQAG